jgi:uncharacterized protein (TIGR03382 family)
MQVNGFVFLAGLCAFCFTCIWVGNLGTGPNPGNPRVNNTIKLGLAAIIIGALLCTTSGQIGVAGLAIGALLVLAGSLFRRRN